MSIDSFPLRIVELINTQNGASLGRRGIGKCVARGVYRFGQHPLANTQVIVIDDPDQGVSMTAQACENALTLMYTRFKDDPIVKDIYEKLAGREFAINFIEAHEYLLDIDATGAIISIACDVAIRLAKTKEQQGFEYLLLLGHCHLFLLWQGLSKRQALAKVADLYSSFSKPERDILHAMLEGPLLDSGNPFSIFLKRVALESTDDIKTQDQKVLLDHHITWLLGQDRVDLPYQRQVAIDILKGDTDPDEQRSQLYSLLRTYDRALEGRNIERISTEVHEAQQQLIFGRMSRAFHNQATLFANAVLLKPNLAWRELAAELFLLVEKIPALLPSTGALKLLLTSTEEVPLTTLEGACERFEDTVLEEQKRALSNAIASSRARMEDCNDPLAGQFNPIVTHDAVMTLTGKCLHQIEVIRQAFLSSAKRHAAYVVISQRPSPTGSHLLIKTNEFQDPYLGKAENLRKLVRLAGERIYCSPDYGWLEVADHWIEAIPLFIKEEIWVHEGQETTRTVIDISSMEVSFREEMADLWARNIQQVLKSELLCLAREYVSAGKFPDLDEEVKRQRLREEFDSGEIAALGILLGEIYREQLDQIQKLIEAEELCHFDALRKILLASESLQQLEEHYRVSGSWAISVRQVLQSRGFNKNFEQQLADFKHHALKPRRVFPTLHVLTTQSAGMTEGYIRTWLEESMALFNIAEDLGLHEEIAEREAFFTSRLVSLGKKIILELGAWIEVDELCVNEQLSQSTAILRLINRNRLIQDELSCLGMLIEFDEIKQGRRLAEECEDINAVEDCLNQHSEALQDAALMLVISRNHEVLSRQINEAESDNSEQNHPESLRCIVLEDEYYRQDLQASMRFAARRRVLEDLNKEHPQLHLGEYCETYLRRFQQLRKTTARKEVIAEEGLNHLTLNPLYYFKATGGGKRYHLIYTPSRVDLGQRERESVETWSQWIGGADRAAIQAGRQIYSLINKDVRIFESLTEPEILKTGENASMASHYAFSNALSMMITASAHGDFEVMADLMNRRFDRHIHPAGEGYGGYCVPKDGLFLEFVLTLNRAEKLRQIGLPEAYHHNVILLANHLLDYKSEFVSQLEWEEWAANQLQQQDCLKPYFSMNRGVQVFQITRIAHVLDNLGKPELRSSYKVASSLAAGWGLHKMVTGGEQVNRFMPFFKAWLIRQSIAEAAKRHPQLPITVENSVVVLTAEYKPDTQDARFATGLRKFEILAGTASHLLNALDRDGRIIAVLMHEGYQALQEQGWAGRMREMLAIDTEDNLIEGQLHNLFPATQPPAEIRMVSPTGLSTQDLLSYTSDTQLEIIADETRKELLALGLTAKEIEANLRTWGTRLSQWSYRVGHESPIKIDLEERFSGRIHVLALATLGPERQYEYALKGADVIDTGIPHRSLLDVLADPAHLCRLMLEGNPNSALVIVDGAAGARHRAMNRGDVMLWFAAGEHLGRETVYMSVGLGQQTAEAWRMDMRRRRRRAELLLKSLTDQDSIIAQQVYERILSEIKLDHEIESALSETDKLVRFGRDNERDRLLSETLSHIGSGILLKDLSFIDFLALGGLYILVGATEEYVRAAEESFIKGIAFLGGNASQTDRQRVSVFLPSIKWAPVSEFRQEKGVESSNKAMEDRPTVALETRRHLATRIAKARAFNLRQAAFNSIQNDTDGFLNNYRKAIDVLGSGNQPVTDEVFGAFLGYTRNALLALAEEFRNEAHPEESQRLLLRLEQLLTGRQTDEKVYQSIAGGYEDIGDFGRMAQGIRERGLQGKINTETLEYGLVCVAQGAELFYIILAIESTLEFTREAPSTMDALLLWRALSSFFSMTINDHSYEYRPWVYSRGTGYADYKGEKMYRLAVERHQWLYSYLRFIVTCYSELRELPVQEQDLLLGNYLNANEVEAIGAEADGHAEKIWRSYGQLRELAFIRNDGFVIPDVFAEFHPDLIYDLSRVNHIFAVPVGRTHFSRALCEGPSLTRELAEEGRRGCNLIITRKIDIVDEPHYSRSVAYISSGHFYVEPATYEDALVAHKGYSRQEAAQYLASRLHPKGIRIAAKFTRPILAALVYPFHGDPIYNTGKLEACGFPFTVQSLFHTWTTYDKAKYRDIFRDSGVNMPDEIDWLSEYTGLSTEKSEIKDTILNGLADTDYPGLLAFARRNPLVMIKDAAESGGRNAQAFKLGRADGTLDSTQLHLAVEFIYQISLTHHVCIQEVILSSPEHWATEEFMRNFVHRQITEWGNAVIRQRQPYTPIFGSHRIILSTDNPNEVDLEKKWHISHWITLNSKQLITNVGRGGTLEQLQPETIRPEHRRSIISKLADAGQRVMEALSRYEAKSAAQYTFETGRKVGADLMGVSYGMPRYLMLDFLIAPVFDKDGVFVEIQPIFDEFGNRTGSRFMLQQGAMLIPGTIVDWRVVLIEPNIGVGLWDRVALREEYQELERARTEGDNPNWDRIGENARIVLRDLNRAGEAYLNQPMTKDAFIP